MDSFSGTEDFIRSFQQLLVSFGGSPGQLESAFLQLPCGVVVAEAPSGRVLLANWRVKEMLRAPFSPADSVHDYTQFRGFFPDGRAYGPADWPLARAVQSGVVTTGEEITFLRGDATLGVMNASAAPLRDSDGHIVAGVLIFTDVTEQRAAEHRLRDLGDLAVQLSAAATQGDVCRVSLERGMATLGAYAAVVMLRKDEGVLELCAQVGYAEKDVEPFRVVSLDRRLPITDAANANAPICIANVEDWAERYPGTRLPTSPTQALVALPLSVDNRVTGALGLSFLTPKRFSEGDRTFMLALAHECALALERAALYDRERKARAEAEEANRAKDDFLATLSHELRTPLNAIMGWAQVLNTQVTPDQQRRGIETIERSARAQSKLIDEMLDLSRIVTGKLQLEVQEVLLAPVVSQVIEASRPAAEAKRISLRATLLPELGSVLGDATRLQQIVWNLLSNAIKFTPKGGHVDVRVDRIGSSARITVGDDGDGIAPDILPYIFERFRQGDSSPKRAHGGLGLGLAITRHLVELHGGTVSAHSDGSGRGAIFTVKLPLAAVRPELAFPTMLASSLGVKRAALRDIHILLVEDADDSRELATLLLETKGARVRAAASAEEAFDLVRRERPDVIVADIGLPGEDGFSLIRRIRDREAREGLERVPAAALTAYATAEDRKRALLAGFNIHLPKPIDGEELTAVVVMLAGRTN